MLVASFSTQQSINNRPNMTAGSTNYESIVRTITPPSPLRSDSFLRSTSAVSIRRLVSSRPTSYRQWRIGTATLESKRSCRVFGWKCVPTRTGDYDNHRRDRPSKLWTIQQECNNRITTGMQNDWQERGLWCHILQMYHLFVYLLISNNHWCDRKTSCYNSNSDPTRLRFRGTHRLLFSSHVSHRSLYNLSLEISRNGN